jgi:hypothetical protein
MEKYEAMIVGQPKITREDELVPGKVYYLKTLSKSGKSLKTCLGMYHPGGVKKGIRFILLHPGTLIKSEAWSQLFFLKDTAIFRLPDTVVPISNKLRFDEMVQPSTRITKQKDLIPKQLYYIKYLEADGTSVMRVFEFDPQGKWDSVGQYGLQRAATFRGIYEDTLIKNNITLHFDALDPTKEIYPMSPELRAMPYGSISTDISSNASRCALYDYILTQVPEDSVDAVNARLNLQIGCDRSLYDRDNNRVKGWTGPPTGGPTTGKASAIPTTDMTSAIPTTGIPPTKKRRRYDEEPYNANANENENIRKTARIGGGKRKSNKRKSNKRKSVRRRKSNKRRSVRRR